MNKTKTNLLMKTIAMVIVCVMISQLFPTIVLGIQEEIELQNENTILQEENKKEETSQENENTLNEEKITQVEEKETKEEENEVTQEIEQTEAEIKEEPTKEDEEENEIEQGVGLPDYYPEVESQIIGEVVEKRTLNEKHFLLKDGTMYLAMYPSNVHYEENGKLIDIDNSLQETNEEGGTLENKTNSFKVKFSKKSNKNNLVKIQINNHNIKWALQNSNKVEAVKVNTNNEEQQGKINLNKIKSGTIKYKNILDNVDIEYNVISDQIKENIILKNKEALNQEISFEYNTNLKMEKTEDGKIILYEENKEDIVLILETPYMYDKKGETSTDIEVELTSKNNKHTLTIKPNKEWLESEERQYPITIDPLVQTSQHYNDIQDTFIFDGDAGNSIKDDADIIRVGSSSTVSTRKPLRGLIKFKNLPNINSGDQIIQARLDICTYDNTSKWTPPTETVQIDVHKMTQDWVRGDAHWGPLFDKYDTRIVDYIKYNYYQNSGWYYFDVTSIVKDWYTTGNNYGVMLKEHQEEYYNPTHSDIYFCSSDVSGKYMSLRPMIQMQYINQSGLESYQTYHIQNIGRAGTTYTNDYNGNIVLIHQDASTPGNLMPVSINHVYNTNDRTKDIGYGQGFRLNLSQTITLETIGGTEYAKYIDEDGTSHYLKKEGAIYKDEDGLSLTLEMQNNGNFIMKDKQSNTLLFEKRENGVVGRKWHLKEAKDTYGNKIVIEFVNNNGEFLIQKVTDAAGDSITFTYENGRLQTITDPKGRTTRYIYSQDYMLQRIQYQDGEESKYVFYGDNRLAAIHNIDDAHITYEYYNERPFRIKAVREYGTMGEEGGALYITYGDNVTIFEDNEGYKNTYSFNNYGQTISTANFGRFNNKDQAYGTMYEYGENQNNKNKLTLEGNALWVNKKENNLVQNGDFSQGLANWGTRDCDDNDKVEDGAFKFIGNSYLDKNIHQRINISGTKGDIYNLAAWVNSRAVQHDESKNTKISISFHFTRNDGSLQVIDKKVNVDGRGWQFQESVVIADSDYSSITIYLVCTNNANETYFDNIGLFKEEFGQSYTYDSKGNVVSTKDNTKNEQKFNYDSNSNLISAINPKGGKFEYQYDTSNPQKLISATNSIGNKYWFNYDSKGNMTNAAVSENADNVPNVDIKYQAHVQDIGWQDWVQNGETAGTYYQGLRVEALNIKLSSNVPNAHVKYRAHVQEIGWQDWLQDGQTTGTLYEAKRMEAIEIKLENLPGYNVKYRVHVQDIGWQNWVSNGQTAGTMYVGKRIEAIEIKLEKTTSNKYYEASAKYTENGNYQTEITDDAGNTTKYEYNEKTGNVSKIIDAKNNETNYTYDGQDRTTKVEKQAGGKTYKNEYTYNKDKLETITHNNFKYTFVYDNYGNVKQTKVGNQILATNNYEEKNGILKSIDYGNGHMVMYTYDGFGRQTRKMGTGSYKYLYDAKSNIQKVYDEATRISTTNTYDLADRLVKQSSNNGFTKEYKYDINNNISEAKYILSESTKTVKYNYDELNRLNSIIQDSSTWENTKDKLSRKTQQKITDTNKTYITQYTYEEKENGKTTPRISTLQNGTSEKITYTYDAVGNIETITKGNTLTNQYYYDELNQLVKEINIPQNIVVTYEYDEGGNIKNKKEYQYNTGTVSSTPRKTITYTYGNTNWKDQLTAYNGKTITYDEIGNATSYDGNTYTWQDGRQLKGISNNTNTITYKYNENGIRTKKIINGETTLYHIEGSKVIYEQVGNNTIYYTYDENGQIIGMNYNGARYYYIKNTQNDIVGILDNNLNQIVRYEYGSWGKITSIKDANGNEITSSTHIGKINPYKYRSYRYDEETGLYYLNSRYYNPEWGRFINADGYVETPTGSLLSLNMYIYCENNPINMIDEDGNVALTSVGTTVGGVIAIVMKAIVYVESALMVAAGAIDISTTIAESNTKAKDKAEPITKKKEKGNHTVYTLYNEVTKTVDYVGRTSRNPNLRENEHKRNPARMNLTFQPVASNITAIQARGLEQRLIEYYGTLNKNNPANNQRNGIGWDNPRRKIYLDAASIFFDENETYVGP